MAAGASSGDWRNLRELLLSNLDAIAGFAVTEQLGLALGVPAVVGVTFPVLRRKTEGSVVRYRSRRRWPGPASAVCRVTVKVALPCRRRSR